MRSLKVVAGAQVRPLLANLGSFFAWAFFEGYGLHRLLKNCSPGCHPERSEGSPRSRPTPRRLRFFAKSFSGISAPSRPGILRFHWSLRMTRQYSGL